MQVTKTMSTKANQKKYLSYKEAFARINTAIAQRFFLEAITIEESIICDRMISYLHYKYAVIFSEKDMTSNKTTMGSLIILWGKEEPVCMPCKDYHNLRGDIDEWRKQRNTILHTMTKSFPGKPTKNVKDFMQDAQQAAKTGKKLARALCELARQGKVKE